MALYKGLYSSFCYKRCRSIMGCVSSKDLSDNVSVIDADTRLRSRLSLTDGKMEHYCVRSSSSSFKSNASTSSFKRIITVAPRESTAAKLRQSVEYKDLEISHEVGKGSNGVTVVQAASFKSSNTEEVKSLFAVKMFNLPESEQKTASALFEQKILLVSTISHPNILTYFGCIHHPKFCIITELCQVSLQNLIETTSDRAISVEQAVAIKIALGCAKACAFLEEKDITHERLKCSNVLLTETFDCKISDFGPSFCEQVAGNLSNETKLWLAPEIFQGNDYSMKADVYSFGILLWEIFNFEKPFQEFNLHDASLPFMIAEKNLRPTLRNSTPVPLQELIRDFWEGSPAYRPTFQVIASRLEFLRDGEVFDRVRTQTILPKRRGSSTLDFFK